MSQSKKSWPENPETLVGAEVLIPAKWRKAYDEDALRGKMSRDIRTALAPRFESNGYGLEEARRRYEEKREVLFQVQTEYNAARDHYYGMLEASLAVQKQGLGEDKEKNLIGQTLDIVRERYAMRQKDLARAQTGVKDARKQALDWCAKQIRDTPLLKERFTTPDALLKELERK